MTARTIGDGDRTDFDETRRLLYMALAAPDTKKYNLVGTLVNALVHHHGVEDLSWREMMDLLITVVDGAEHSEASRTWVLDQISRIGEELGD